MTGPRVLIVDDNAALVANLREILRSAAALHADVHATPDGETAVSFAKERGFDVALVDVQLPGESGVEVIERLRAAQPLGEIVIITGYATVGSAIAALSAGAFAFLLKSFRPEELVATVRRAHEKVRLQRERDALERGRRALFETAGVLLVAINGDDRVVLFNPRVAELTAAGVPMAPLAPVADYLVEEDRERVVSALGRARSGDRTVSVEARLTDGVSPAGKRVEWHLAGAGTGDLVYGVGVDVTERRELERRAVQAEALSAMGALALGLAHEIRNPLNAAVLQLHLLSRQVGRLPDGDGVGMKRRIGIVQGEIGRLERLLSEFLDLARPRGIHRTAVDVSQLVRSVLALEDEALLAVGITVEIALDDRVVVSGDAEKLKQVLLNLLGNARDALSERGGGKISIRVSHPDDPTLAIEDDGPGIEARLLESVFDAFFTTKPAGTGLGLAIVRKIVDQHGGQIVIDTEVGRGTRVTVRLPRAPDDGVAPLVASR